MDLTFGLTVKQRLIAMLLATVVMLIGMLSGALWALSSQLDDMNEMYIQRVQPMQQLKQIADDFSTQITATTWDRLNGVIGWEEGLQKIQAGREDIEADWSLAPVGELDARELALADEIEPRLDAALEQLDELEQIFVTQNGTELGAFALTKLQTMADPVLEGIRELSNLQISLAEQTYQNAASGYATFRLIMILVIAAVMVFLVFGVYLLLQGIVAPLKIAEDYTRAIAGGDLHTTLPVKAKDEIYSMITSLNEMSDGLAEVIDDVAEVAATMTDGVREIAHGNMNLSERTEQQAASLEETASSMEEMTATVKQNADNARQANELAAEATQQAERGVDIASVAMSAMGEINNASQKISEITAVVDEIAFQTNLLALNAAVEAARAGDAGRGFAVVAAEVRVLAQRSAEAAKQIKNLIEDSVAKVDSGSALVQQSSDALGDIVTAIKQVSVIMREISASSAEQSDGIEQVNDAITQMDQMTQQNAALVEEAAAAARALETEAGNLDQRVGFFETRRSRSAPPRSPGKPDQKPVPARAVAGAKNPTSSLPKPASRPSGNDDNWQEF